MERSGRLLTGIALLLVVCGCGAATTAPVPPGDDGAPQFDTGALPRLVTRSVDFVGDVGGSVENGRWNLDVSAGAIEGNARITIAVSYTKTGECTMAITPADKNKFDVPALLTVDCASLTDEQLAQSVILEFDPVTRQWFELPGSSVDMPHRTVSVPVDHVARYTVGPAGGKAGW